MCSILLDEMIESMIQIIQHLYVDEKKVEKNLHITKGQIFAEFVLQALIKKGVPRMSAYKDVQRIAFSANGNDIHFIDAIKKDKKISSKFSKKEIKQIFSPENHLGASLSIITNVNNTVQKAAKKFI